MNPNDLLSLDRLSDSPLAKVRVQDPELFTQLSAKATAERKAVVTAAFAGASAELKSALADVDYSPTKRGDRPLRQVILESLAQQRVPAQVAEEAVTRVLELERSAALVDPAAMTTPVREHPLFQDELRQAAVVKIAVAAKLDLAQSEKVLSTVTDPDTIDDGAITALLKTQAVDKPKAAELGLVSTLYHLADDQVAVAEGLRRGLADIDLGRLTGIGSDGWVRAIRRGEVTPPGEQTPADYADRLDRTVSGMFPTDALMTRVLRDTTANQIKAAIEANDQSRLTELVNVHPGLGLDAVLASNKPAAERAATIAANIDLVRQVQARNPRAELLTLDYGPDSEDVAGLDFGNLTGPQRQLVVADLKAYQRAFAITDDVTDAHRLLKAGYHTAVAVGTSTLAEFRARTGLPDALAERYHTAGKASVARLTTGVVSLVDVLRGGFVELYAGNILPSIADYLRKLDGFADLFGSQDYCACAHCQSILSPAAYFVDLMSFVDEHINKEYFAGAKASDPLHLKVRRPDLWTLLLSCENTTTVLPYLDVINEICENHLASRLGFTGSLGNRAAVEDFVYRQHLATSVDSFSQPFTLPLVRLTAYLAHFERSRADVADALAAPAATRAAAGLDLAKREHDLVTQPNANLNFLQRVYGLTFSVGAGGVVSPVDVQELLAKTGLTRSELGDLVATQFVTANGAEPVEIKPAKRTPASVQNDIERIHGLRTAALDRLHRFTRLYRAVNRVLAGSPTGPGLTAWTVPEFDLLVTQLVATGVPAGIGTPTLTALVDVLGIHRRFTLTVEQNCALWGPIPRAALPGSAGSAFDRLFNLPTFVRLDGTLPKDTVSFVHPSLRTPGVPAPADNTLHRLLAALGVSDEQLAGLITRLAGPLGANLTAPNEDDRGFLLTAANLNLLHRHARLTQLLRTSVADLFALLERAGLTQVGSLADLVKLLEFADWQRESGLSLDDLALITRGTVQRPAAYPDPATLAATVVSRIAADKDLDFADTVFAFVPGVTEDQSRALVAANAARFETTPTGTLRLVPTFDPAVALTVPAGLTAAEPALREALLAHHTRAILLPRLAAQLSLAADLVGPLVAMTRVSLDSAPLAQALRGGPIAPLVDLIDKLIRLTVLFGNPVYDAGTLDFLRRNGAVFGITNYTAIDVAGIRRLSGYASLAAATIASDFTPLTPPLDPADVWHVFGTFDPAQHFANTDKQRLAATLGTEPALIATLLPHLTLPADASGAVDMLRRCVTLTTYLGVDGNTLARIVSDAYADLTKASEAILSAFRAKYPDEAEFTTKLEPFEDWARGRRRDGLTDHLIRSIQPGFDDLDAIYEYLLVDPQLEGCARTSRVVAAISSVQLYVHRILLNLEQDQRDPGDPQRTAVPAAAIPTDEWVWRKNYRVWEANRKVFLWPENYIEPELRDDKTPLFTELESTLLQQTVDEQNVLDAYGSYLSGLEEVARLQISGAYHQKDEDERTDLLHLFGVTPADPPIHYYRTIRNAHYGQQNSGRGVSYGSWQKIDVQIPVRKVAPIVYLGRLFVFWVEIVTTPKNEVKDAGSKFVGYKHRMTLKYTTLRLDGGWTPPQVVSLAGGTFSIGDGIVDDPLAETAEREALTRAIQNFDYNAAVDALADLNTPRYDVKAHYEPIDGYTVEGFQWDRVYPATGTGELRVTGRNFVMRAGVDFYRKAIVPRPTLSIQAHKGNLLSSRQEGSFHRLYAGWPSFFVIDAYAQASVAADRRRIDALARVRESAWLVNLVNYGLFKAPLGWLLTPPDTTVVNGSISDALIDLNGDLLYLQGSVRPGAMYVARRLGTTLGERMSRQLFSSGVDGLLATRAQLALKENVSLLLPDQGLDNEIVSGRIDYRGAFGTYLREVFFHIPFLIANHLNSQQNFAAAQRWYHYIFDPTAAETITVPAGTPAEERAKRERDRVWRYPEFRRLDLPSLREVLTDPAAIEAYKKDPFNPHAIARLRLSAYQKCVVMRYIDNLLDWGDSLFNRFTMESVNEATMLYVTAGQVLGRRPAKLGGCGESTVTPRNYETIAPLIAKGSEFLIELENVIWSRSRAPAVYGRTRRTFAFAWDRPTVSYFADRAAVVVKPPAPPVPDLDPRALAADIAAGPDGIARAGAAVTAAHQALAAPLVGENALVHAADWNRTYISSWDSADVGASGQVTIRDTRQPTIRDTRQIVDSGRPLIKNFERIPHFGWSVIRQISPVFCVPTNTELLSYWDRVEDRLFKIRHCLDISGVPRQLALFAPEIDPRLLVRAAAAGLSIEDVLDATSGDLPPYRFQYLIEKARQHAAVVQAFGSALLSALEKKDTEELNRLRTVHQQNLQKMTTRVREWEIDIAADQLETLARQTAAAQYRHDYYRGLLDVDLTAWERTQQVSRHTASVLSGAAGLVDTVAGVLYLLPQVGSPFAMKYGGQETGNSANAWAMVAKDAASVAEAVSSSAGLEAGFERRRDGWEHQRKLAELELKQLAKQTTAAELRRRIAVRSLELHTKQIEQLEEIFDLYGARFSNLATYTFLSTLLQRLYRDAYNSAYATARLAEQAYRFERDDETTQLLRGSYFDAGRAGLLAGEQLQVDLETMERRFIETNYRQPEIDQAFSLTQIDPAALVRLRETGECSFEIPEVFFDLFYPGHYRRRLRSVRLTMPCVTGPYTNVGATLTLTGSKIRRQPQLGAASLVDVPVRRSAAIATSTAQNDAGVFEFSFRDERYMPFEGAGAVSAWRLALPKSFRPFDYQTLTDVIVHVSYTADADEVFRGKVEQLNAAIDGTILNYLSSNEIGRVFSFRQDFSTEFNRLLHSAAGTPVAFELTDRHLPMFLRGRPITVSAAKLLLRAAPGQSANGVRLRLDSTNLTTFTHDPNLGNLFAADAAAVFAGGLLGSRTLTVVAAGSLAPAPPVPADPSAIDLAKLLDVQLYLAVKIT